MSENEMIESIKKKVGAGVLGVTSQKRKTSVTIEPSVIRQVVQALLEHQPRFVIIAAVDLGMDIELLYHFDVEGKLIVVRTKIPKEDNQIDTIVDLMPAAEWAEKEAAELFGINFSAHPKARTLCFTKRLAERQTPAKGVVQRSFARAILPGGRVARIDRNDGADVAIDAEETRRGGIATFATS